MSGHSSAEKYLEAQRHANEELAEDWQTIEKFYSKKLWHQLTLTLLDFVKKDAVYNSNILIEDFYSSFLSDFEHIISPLALAEMLLIIMKRQRQVDPAKAVEFGKGVRDRVLAKAKDGCLATVLAEIGLGFAQLEDLKDAAAARQLIEDANSKLQEFDYVTPVHDRYFALSSAYHREQGNHAEYYREALRYLGCTKLDSMPDAEKRAWASTIAVAALLGQGVYNFGELLMHDVLQSLQGTDQEWMVELLFAFNSGDIGKFSQLKPKWSSQPDLAKMEAFLQQKITLMCLIELAFTRPITERLIPFAEISKATRVPADEVEFLLMRALSLDLIRGKINEVDKCILISWVQPRVLNLSQIASMQSKLSAWLASAATMEEIVQQKAAPILA